MKQHNILTIALFALIACASILNTASAQCGIQNTAFQSGEKLDYQLYFNWQFMWLKAGTAQMQITQNNYEGHEGFRCHLITRGNQRTDKYFMMRDTLECYVKNDCTPLYFRKGALEGSRYTVDEVWYTYPGDGTVALKQRYHDRNANIHDKSYSTNVCTFDMLSMLLRARSFDASKFTKGQIIKFPLCDGDDVKQAILIYRGKKQFKMENTKVKYKCLVFSFIEKDGSKDKEVVTFYVTDDLNHMPVRIDLNLKFGTAKAFLTNAENLRNPQTSIIQ